LEKAYVSWLVQVLGYLAVFFSFLPLIFYWSKGLAENKSYMVISIFWLINGIIYAPEIFHWRWYVPVDEEITLYYNLMDVPLIMLIFYYAFEKRVFLYMIGFFAFFETIVIAVTGFNRMSNDIIIGVGSLLCLALNIWGIGKYFRQLNHTATEKAYLCIFAGFIFYYGLCIDLIYIFKIFNFSSSQKKYQDLINFTAMVTATGLISYGFFRFGHPDQRRALSEQDAVRF